MQFYWRMIEELRYLGETIIFCDPSLQRQYAWWLKKNAAGVAFSRETGEKSVISQGWKDLCSLASMN